MNVEMDTDMKKNFEMVAKLHPWFVDAEVIAHLKKKYKVDNDVDAAMLYVYKKR